jgi:hypothetical protein
MSEEVSREVRELEARLEDFLKDEECLWESCEIA